MAKALVWLHFRGVRIRIEFGFLTTELQQWLSSSIKSEVCYVAFSFLRHPRILTTRQWSSWQDLPVVESRGRATGFFVVERPLPKREVDIPPPQSNDRRNLVARHVIDRNVVTKLHFVAVLLPQNVSIGGVWLAIWKTTHQTSSRLTRRTQYRVLSSSLQYLHFLIPSVRYGIVYSIQCNPRESKGRGLIRLICIDRVTICHIVGSDVQDQST